jgi:hypothetical protein
MDGEEIAQRIGVITKHHLGRRMGPHLFRECLAADIAIYDPTHVGIERDVLDHATFATTEKYYVQAGSFEASRRQRDRVARWRGQN